MAKQAQKAKQAHVATHAPQGADWEGGDWDVAREEAPEGRHLDAVAAVLAALPPGIAGRTLKLALLDALDASTRADRVALPVEVQGLRARVRAGTA
jgi:hypothetical protein